jgi:hypothetical protein
LSEGLVWLGAVWFVSFGLVCFMFKQLTDWIRVALFGLLEFGCVRLGLAGLGYVKKQFPRFGLSFSLWL